MSNTDSEIPPEMVSSATQRRVANKGSHTLEHFLASP